jgi:hypothetical protein
MNGGFESDFSKMEKIMRDYIEKGCVIGPQKLKVEPIISTTPSTLNFTSLKTEKKRDLHFFAVDCSTRTLRRANNWAIYVCRVSYAVVQNRDVDWGYKETIRAVKGDAYVRRKIMQETRLQLESEMALKLERIADDEDFILLDGASYFGGERRFNVLLYEACARRGIKLLTISKQSPMLRDHKGRDLIASTSVLGPKGCWAYHPVKKANIHEHLYGDVSIIKLCEESPRTFRCDIMSYLLDDNVQEILSPLCSISEDPRCSGYPVALWLAHDFSGLSETKLIHYYVEVEDTLKNAGLLDILRKEELACNFADEIHGIKHAFSWERISNV